MPKRSKTYENAMIGAFSNLADDAFTQAAERSLMRAKAAEVLQNAKAAGAVGRGSSTDELKRRLQSLRAAEVRRKAKAAGFVKHGGTEADIGRRLDAILAVLSPPKKKSKPKKRRNVSRL